MNKCAFCDNDAAEGFGLCEQCLWNDWLEHQPVERTPPAPDSFTEKLKQYKPGGSGLFRKHDGTEMNERRRR